MCNTDVVRQISFNVVFYLFMLYFDLVANFIFIHSYICKFSCNMLIFYIKWCFFYIYSFSFLFKLGRYLGHYLCYYLASSSFFYIYAIPSAFIVVVVIILCKCQL